MKKLKTPARLPRKAPSNQTGGTAWGKKLAAEISRMTQAADMKKLILLNFPYIIAFYMVEKAAWLYRHCNGDSVVDRLMVLFMNFGLAYKSVLPSFHPFDLMVGLVGAAALKAEWNATLYCEKADLAGDRMYPLSAADCGYTEGEQIAVDELRFTVWHTPGHTPGSVVLLCGEHLFCGDTLFAGSIGRTDLEGGSSAQMADSLRKLAQLPIPRETQVLPGHGEFSTFGAELDNNYYIRSALRGGNDIF